MPFGVYSIFHPGVVLTSVTGNEKVVRCKCDVFQPVAYRSLSQIRMKTFIPTNVKLNIS